VGWVLHYEGSWPARLDAAAERRFREHVARRYRLGPYAPELDPLRGGFRGFTQLDPLADPARDFEHVLASLRELDTMLPGAEIVVRDDHYVPDGCALGRLDTTALVERVRADHAGNRERRDAYQREVGQRIAEALESPEFQHLSAEARRRVRERLTAELTAEADLFHDDDDRDPM
jgi:hypothetical protein